MADLGEEAFSSQMKVVATFLRLLEELMRNKQQDLRYGTKTQRRGILGRMKDFVGGIFKKVYDGTFGRLSRNGKDYGQLDLNDPAVAKLFADTMKQMGMDAMHEDNNLLFSTSDVAKILAFSKMVEQELGKKIEHENDTPEKEQSQEHGQDQERQANARGWSDYPATPEQIDLTATVLAADEGVSIDEIKKDFSENPSIGELQIALEAKGHDTMAIQPDLKNYATPEQRAQLDIGHRKFFNPSSQLNVNAANDAAVFNEILNEKMRQGVSNIRRKMYITFSVSAPTVDDAVPKLARIENQISQILTSIGSKSHVLDGAERLALLNSQLNPLKPFNFDYRRDISARMVQTTKDCIAPMTLDFKPEGLADCFKTGDMWGQVLVIKKLGSELTDQALSDITELPIPLNVTWFAQPMDKAAAVAFTRQRLAWIDKEIIEEQRSAVQKGYDFSILPQELKYSKEETEDVIDNLQNKNQRLYVFTGLFYTYAPTKKQLDNQVLSIISAARQNSIEVSTYEYRQRQGFNSILPLGHNHCEISRMSTTAEVSILMPFATMELDDKGGNYYGQNKHSSNLIFCNRKLLASPMGFVCGKTGSGKGMAVKTEMTGTILSNPTDEIYIIDRAGEYTGISSRYGGVTYNFAVDSDTYLNPFDTVSVESLSPDAQLAFKIDAMLMHTGAYAWQQMALAQFWVPCSAP